MLFVAGLVLLLLGILSGTLLVLAPLGLTGAAAGLTLWILFPVFTITGYLLAALPARTAALAWLTRGSGIVLLVLAMVAAVALVLQGGALVETRGDSFSLWYVLAVGLVLGSTGVASFRRGTPDAI
jgi:hypothetical protein